MVRARSSAWAGPGRPGGAGWTATGAASPSRPCRAGGDRAADTGPGNLEVELADQRVIVSHVVAAASARSRLHLGLGAQGQPVLLRLIGRGRAGVGFVLEMPALPALRDAQRLGPFGARRADAGQGRPARYHHLLGLAGHGVGAAQLDRAQAPAAGFGDLPDRVTGQRHRHPLGPGRGGRSSGHLGSVVAGPGVRPAAERAVQGDRACPSSVAVRAGVAARARVIGPPARRGQVHQAASPSIARSPRSGRERSGALSGHGPDVLIGHPGGADPHRVGVGFQPDERHPGAGRRVSRDQVRGGARGRGRRRRAPCPPAPARPAASRSGPGTGSGCDMTSLRGSCSAATTQ